MANPLARASNVLIVCLDNIGDLVWAGALAKELKRVHPSRAVGLWCKSYAADTAPFIPGWDRLHACDPFWEASPGGGGGSFKEFRAVLSEIKSAGYDAAIIVNTRWKVCAAVAAAGVGLRVGFAQRLSGPWLTYALAREDRSREVLDEWARLLEPFCSIEERLIPVLRVPQGREDRLAEIKKCFDGPRIAVLHPSAGDARRCAPLSFWRDAAVGLADAGFSIGWVGRPDELTPLRELLGASAQRYRWVDRLGSGSLQESLLMTAAASLFIGHDSGPLHAAAAFGVPSIGLYLPGDWPRARPTGTGPIRVFRRARPEELDSLDVVRAARALTEFQEASR